MATSNHIEFHFTYTSLLVKLKFGKIEVLYVFIKYRKVPNDLILDLVVFFLFLLKSFNDADNHFWFLNAI